MQSDPCYPAGRFDRSINVSKEIRSDFIQTIETLPSQLRKEVPEVSLQLPESVHTRRALPPGSLSDEKFEKTLPHPELKIITLNTSPALYAWHSRHHIAHITEFKKRMDW